MTDYDRVIEILEAYRIPCKYSISFNTGLPQMVVEHNGVLWKINFDNNQNLRGDRGLYCIKSLARALTSRSFYPIEFETDLIRTRKCLEHRGWIYITDQSAKGQTIEIPGFHCYEDLIYLFDLDGSLVSVDCGKFKLGLSIRPEDAIKLLRELDSETYKEHERKQQMKKYGAISEYLEDLLVDLKPTDEELLRIRELMEPSMGEIIDTIEISRRNEARLIKSCGLYHTREHGIALVYDVDIEDDRAKFYLVSEYNTELEELTCTLEGRVRTCGDLHDSDLIGRASLIHITDEEINAMAEARDKIIDAI